jgi:polyisoprenoid-binding protein YceI
MNLTKLKAPTAAFGLILLLAPLSWGQAAVKPGGSLWIEGDSTLHRWSSTSTAVELSFTPAEGAAMTVEAVKASRIKGVAARIPVSSLKSGEGGLDKNMLKAMNADKFPEILYKLVSYEPPKTGDGGVLKTKTTGELTIAGKTKTVAIDMEFEPGPDGLRVRGAYQLKMSDYGITPPKLFLGTIKTRDPVTIRFDLSLNAPKETSK